MSIPEIANVHVNIMGRTFNIKCPKNKVEELQEASLYLEKKMGEITGTQCSTIDRVAIVSALNIAHEVILKKKPSSLAEDASNQDVIKRIVRMQKKLEDLKT